MCKRSSQTLLSNTQHFIIEMDENHGKHQPYGQSLGQGSNTGLPAHEERVLTIQPQHSLQQSTWNISDTHLTFSSNTNMTCNRCIWLVEWLFYAQICKSIFTKDRASIHVGSHEATLTRKGLNKNYVNNTLNYKAQN